MDKDRVALQVFRLAKGSLIKVGAPGLDGEGLFCVGVFPGHGGTPRGFVGGRWRVRVSSIMKYTIIGHANPR
ncbi:hypothetical protein DSLASN_04590 [Desulfoluna limicola]|uniref:Uncharacterized protein n=1 Tax=Desulfoluna limicola TaxID=2810562 RepID=A0ABM7PCM9_9BACT|nr:hypothetical protein DSLASN_04590 [Desulfoluna limicola]